MTDSFRFLKTNRNKFYFKFKIEEYWQNISPSLNFKFTENPKKIQPFVIFKSLFQGVYTMSIMALMLIYFSFDVKDYTYNIPIFSAYLTLFLTYGIAAILYAYVLQRFFSISVLAVIIIYAVMFFFGIILTITTIILEIYMKTVRIFAHRNICIFKWNKNIARGHWISWEYL